MKSIKNDLVIEYLNKLYPNARCSLDYSKDYELVIAVILSAQSTDKKVNEITKILFNKYKTIDAYINVPIKDIEEIIKPLGLYKNKALSIKDFAFKLVNKYNYVIPSSKKELLTIKGIGNKVANVILIELFHIEEFPVDTHIYRFSKRLNYISIDDSINKAEEALKKAFPKKYWIKLHHQIIFFGRYKCKSQNPSCKDCRLIKYCNFNNSL